MVHDAERRGPRISSASDTAIEGCSRVSYAGKKELYVEKLIYFNLTFACTRTNANTRMGRMRLDYARGLISYTACVRFARLDAAPWMGKYFVLKERFEIRENKRTFGAAAEQTNRGCSRRWRVFMKGKLSHSESCNSENYLQRRNNALRNNKSFDEDSNLIFASRCMCRNGLRLHSTIGKRFRFKYKG